jgi:hypothetical protein
MSSTRRIRWAGHVTCPGDMRNGFRILAGKPERKRPLGRQRNRYEVNIKINLKEIGCEDVDWILLAEDCVH